MARITLIAFGTRGDAQPAIALGKGLRARGHQVTVLASAHFKSWVESHGLEAAVTDVNIQEIMESEGGQDWVERGHNPLVQMRIMRRLLLQSGLQMAKDAWEACQGADVIVSSFTSDVYAVSIAEKLGARHVSAPLQPTLWSTRNGNVLMNAPAPNRVSLFNYIFGKIVIEPAAWRLYGDLTNQFRQEILGLPPQTYRQNKAAREEMLIVHAYSHYVVPHPKDWPESYHTVGYFFLDEEQAWQPPADLMTFIEAGERPICIGFGSMTGRDPRRMTDIVRRAVKRSGRRAVLLSGWGKIGEAELPDSIYCLRQAPHTWLFPRMAAVVHHGGAGSTAAGLRAGVPSILIPHFADQPFWANRVEALGVGPKGILRHRLIPEVLADAIAEATTNPDMAHKAAELGRKIRAEDGVERAVDLIEAFIRA
ncbi:MAG: glycosyltransferase [Candidatus Promineifilaceae bacterium]